MTREEFSLTSCGADPLEGEAKGPPPSDDHHFWDFQSNWVPKMLQLDLNDPLFLQKKKKKKKKNSV